MAVLWGVVLVSALIGVRLAGSPLRVLIHNAACYGQGRLRTAGRCLEHHVNYLNMFYMIVTFGGVVGATYLLFGADHVLEGLVLAVAAITLLFVQGPRMGAPLISAAWMRATDGGAYDDTPMSWVSIPSQEASLLFVRISNLGMNPYENCTARFHFPEGFKILSQQVLYADIDFRKTMLVQTRNRCAVFEPAADYLTVAPGNHAVFPMWVEPPKVAGEHEVQVVFDCQSRWGEARARLRLDVIQSPPAPQDHDLVRPTK